MDLYMNDDFGFQQQGNVPPSGGQQTGYAPPQGGYGQQQTGYAPPPPGGYSYMPPVSGQSGKGGGWIGLLRTFLWIYFGLICLVGLILFIGFSQAGDGGVLMGLLALAGCVLVAFISVAGGMVALDAAQNISRCATNSARILELLQHEKR